MSDEDPTLKSIFVIFPPCNISGPTNLTSLKMSSDPAESLGKTEQVLLFYHCMYWVGVHFSHSHRERLKLAQNWDLP